MRSAALALVSVCALAACNPSAPGGDAGVFPDLNAASYRAEATIVGDDGATIPVVTIRDGRKLRMEMNTADGQTVFIANPESGEDFIISTVGGQQTAMRMTQLGQTVEDPTAAWSGDMSANATRTGTCSVAGESGVEWTRPEDEDGMASTACVTRDGIILRASEGAQTVWETTSVQRGPQSADLFTLPPGVEVVDLGAFGQAVEDAMGRAEGAGE